MPSYGKSGNETICLAMVNLGMRLYALAMVNNLGMRLYA